MMKNRSIFILFFLLFFLTLPMQQAFSEDLIGHTEGSAVSVYDMDGNYIFASAMGVTKGDRYINEANIEYLVKEVNGNRAIARKQGVVDLLADIGKEVSQLTPIAAGGKKLIGIYFTHNDESYEPGPDNISGRGEIHQVGAALKAALEKRGIRVIKSDDLHLPHDGAAYERSKGTALKIEKQRPDALFDVHRDAIPRKNAYLTKVNGQEMTKIEVVVGRQNPNQKVNDKFARQLKAIADKQHPGLIRGIFYGKGDYNQELSPHSLLLEFGTNVTTKNEAETSTNMIADTINQLLYGGKGNQPTKGARAQENSSALTTIAWILGIVIVGILAFLFINEGSWNGVVERIKGFFGREILDRGDKE